MGGELDKVPISVSNVCHGGFRNFALLTDIIIIRCFTILSETCGALKTYQGLLFIVHLLVINKRGEWNYNSNFTGTARPGPGRATGGADGADSKAVMAESPWTASGPD